jgi:hypothetical protein
MAVLGTAVAWAGGVNSPIPIDIQIAGGVCKVITPPYAQRRPGAIVWHNLSNRQAIITFQIFPGTTPPAAVTIAPGTGPSPGVGVAILNDIGFYKYTVRLAGRPQCELDPWLDID